MSIVQCKICRKPFDSISGKICPECLQKIDKDFVKVRDFIYDNKKADIDTVAEKTEVDKTIILHLLREGRLTLGDSGGGKVGGALICEVCKKPISSGRMCRECMNKLANTMIKNDPVKAVPLDQQKKPAGEPKSTKGMHTRFGDKS